MNNDINDEKINTEPFAPVPGVTAGRFVDPKLRAQQLAEAQALAERIKFLTKQSAK